MAQRLVVRSLYRRSLRAAAFSIDSQVDIMLSYIRIRFRENSASASRRDALPMVLREAEAELQDYVRLLCGTGRISTDAVVRLREPDSYEPSPAATSSKNEAKPAAAASNSWDKDAVGEWLKGLDLEQHIDAFAAAHVDGPLLLRLDDADLLELSVTSRLERKRLLLEIERISS